MDSTLIAAIVGAAATIAAAIIGWLRLRKPESANQEGVKANGSLRGQEIAGHAADHLSKKVVIGWVTAVIE